MNDDHHEEASKLLPLIPNLASIHFLRQAGAMLDLPVRTTATAIMYYHQFNRFMLLNKGGKPTRNDRLVDESMPLNTNEELLTTTCLHLACKMTDVPRKVRDLVNVGYRYYHPKEGILQIDETYFKMRSSLVVGELLLVRALGYDLEVSLPFTYCLNVLRGMASVSWFAASSVAATTVPSTKQDRRVSSGHQKDYWRSMEQEMDPELSTIARVAWMFCWDSICSPKIVLTRTTAEVALGCLYLALELSHTELPVNMNQWVDMWGASENISVQNVCDVVTDLIELFAHCPSIEDITPSTFSSATSPPPPPAPQPSSSSSSQKPSSPASA
ncbi:cyclin-like protein [Zychaea mexicana]|uniref:cyclin-like protein n=1 Tax=Zychaea mexicana TaxID=64656 RepID=UPI0022FE3C08|nr:cyclin-like protein [Zychaea mexicana]KAI9492435.1 cyclin-like protein [Zychaea mexicana]